MCAHPEQDDATKYKNVKPMGDDDETFVFARLPQGEDAFTCAAASGQARGGCVSQ